MLVWIRFHLWVASPLLTSSRHAAIRRPRADHRRRPSHSRNRKLFHVREESGLRFVSKLATGIFGDLSGAAIRKIPVVSGGDNEPNVYLEGTKV